MDLMGRRLRRYNWQWLERDRTRDSMMPGWRTARDLQPGDTATTDYECGYGVGGALIEGHVDRAATAGRDAGRLFVEQAGVDQFRHDPGDGRLA